MRVDRWQNGLSVGSCAEVSVSFGRVEGRLGAADLLALSGKPYKTLLHVQQSFVSGEATASSAGDKSILAGSEGARP
jgi:hypothetical protein